MLRTRITIALLFLCFCFCFFRQLEEDALFTHLAAGRHVWQTKSLHIVEPFAYLYRGETWHNSFLLSDLITYLLFSGVGYKGLWILPWGSILFVLLIMISRRLTLWEILFAVFLILVAIFPVLKIGPHNYAILFSVSTVVLIFSNRRPWIWLLVPLQLLWVNSHPTFLFGPLTVIVFFLVKRLQSSQHSTPWFPMLATFGCCLVSPSGYLGILEAIKYFRTDTVSLWNWPGLWATLLLGLGSLYLSRKRGFPAAEIVITVLWGIFSLCYEEWTIS